MSYARRWSQLWNHFLPPNLNSSPQPLHSSIVAIMLFSPIFLFNMGGYHWRRQCFSGITHNFTKKGNCAFYYFSVKPLGTGSKKCLFTLTYQKYWINKYMYQRTKKQNEHINYISEYQHHQYMELLYQPFTGQCSHFIETIPVIFNDKMLEKTPVEECHIL